MRRILAGAASSLSALLLGSTISYAAEFTVVAQQTGTEPAVITMKGQLVQGDDQKFVELSVPIAKERCRQSW